MNDGSGITPVSIKRRDRKDYQRQYYQQHKQQKTDYYQQTKNSRAAQYREKKKTAGPLPFAAVDGEGGTISGRHEYLLLRAGQHLLQTGKPLTTYDCLGFLADLPRGHIYVAFAFNYDVTMILNKISADKITSLFDRGSREIFSNGQATGRYYPVTVGHGEFDIDYIPSKEFKVRRRGNKYYTVIHDTFTFFQSSFIKTLHKWFDDQPEYTETIEKIAEGKEQRAEFGQLTHYEVEYNLIECDMLEKLMEKFRSMCTSLGMKPRVWQGPGNLVTEVFKQQGMPRDVKHHVPNEVWEFANNCYYGGRFEDPVIGHITQPVYQYDVNSAYAATYHDLPCLIHGAWKKITRIPPSSSTTLWMARVDFQHHQPMNVYTLPLRLKHGTIWFPRNGSGWYCSYELNIARHHARLNFWEGWEYVQNCDCRFFDWVPELYDERIRVGKDSGQGKILKTVLATIYGKLCQSIGTPPYSNPIWASIITSKVRATIIAACLQVDNGSDVLMIATDGIFTLLPRELPISTQRGDWTLTKHPEAFIVQSGVYFMSGHTPKTRGVPLSKILQNEHEFRQKWADYCRLFEHNRGQAEQNIPDIIVTINKFHSLRESIARHRPEQAGTWSNDERHISFDWNSKRCHPILKGTALYTEAPHGLVTLCSTPYPRFIGGSYAQNVSLRHADIDQPDWADQLGMAD